jgi:hypothetical protein
LNFSSQPCIANKVCKISNEFQFQKRLFFLINIPLNQASNVNMLVKEGKNEKKTESIYYSIKEKQIVEQTAHSVHFQTIRLLISTISGVS